ncbi:PiggyBac transposable element-derived protein 4 [Elysia marginata]|uniref:PiggyBac transposable element-derived protein 4 n=1 Tax=Elysia marginata TaxID=1093978 RepID=A0AAV4FD08_9GAST|nr:PiggyBac transposable element-derived protein 4 [Elysia marginata]
MEFASVIPRDRLLSIWRFLHVAENRQPGAARPGRLAQLRPMLDHLNSKFRFVYVPNRDIHLWPGPGLLPIHASETHKWGHLILVYGKELYWEHEQEEDREQGLAHWVVLDLVAPYYKTNMRVTMDNFYTSVPLLRDLGQKEVLATGTIHSNFLPKDLLPKTASLTKHKCRVAQAGNLTYWIWMDTKAVLVMSNYHCPTQTGEVRRKAGQRDQQQVVVPIALANYQEKIKGVDLCDQMLGYYMPSHRSKKWWRRVNISQWHQHIMPTSSPKIDILTML